MPDYLHYITWLICLFTVVVSCLNAQRTAKHASRSEDAMDMCDIARNAVTRRMNQWRDEIKQRDMEKADAGK